MTDAAPEPLLYLDRITKRFGATVAAEDLTLAIYPGEFFTLLGPSGSGKSTILRLIAGLERPDQGRVLIGGRDMLHVPPWRRGLGMVFQHYAVFPHMTVAQNVGYGLRIRKTPRARVLRRVRELLTLVGLAGLDNKNVTVLSGGEQQRVALARALAVEPALLLLDEPLGALDEKIRREMQTELKQIQRTTGTTFVYVTHDQEEALTMSDRIAVIHRGVSVQCDTPDALFRRPRTRFVAGFFRGSNVLDADVERVGTDRVHMRLGGVPLTSAARPQRWTAGQPRVAVAIRAENVHVGPRALACAARFEAMLVNVIYRGATVDHVLETDDGQHLTATSTQREVDGVGRRIAVGFEPEHVVVLDD